MPNEQWNANLKLPNLKLLCGDADPNEPAPLQRGETPTPWLATSGVVAHPNAPQGAGGQGHFRGARHLGARGNQALSLAHPSSPEGRHDLSEEESSRVELQKQKKNKAPRAKSRKRKISKQIGNTKIDVTIEILLDVVKNFNDPNHKGKAATKLDITQVNAADSRSEDTPQGKVKGTRWEYTGIVTIQTMYKPGVDVNAQSGYGRGTTDPDKTNGDITLGFHESCHREDFWTYYTTNQFPLFTGKDGMTVAEYDKAVTDTLAAWFGFEDAAQDESELQTDEVGDPPASKF